MPELLTQPKTPDRPARWPESNRNGGRLQIGTVADIKSVSLAGFRRNPQADEAELGDIYETERRLLYVACTRAREHLLLTGVAPVSEYLADFIG